MTPPPPPRQVRVYAVDMGDGQTRKKAKKTATQVAVFPGDDGHELADIQQRGGNHRHLYLLRVIDPLQTSSATNQAPGPSTAASKPTARKSKPVTIKLYALGPAVLVDDTANNAERSCGYRTSDGTHDHFGAASNPRLHACRERERERGGGVNAGFACCHAVVLCVIFPWMPSPMHIDITHRCAARRKYVLRYGHLKGCGYPTTRRDWTSRHVPNINPHPLPAFNTSMFAGRQTCGTFCWQG